MLSIKMSMFAKFYQTKSVCYDSDYEENDFQPPDEDDEPDTLDESVPSNCLFTKQTEKYPELIPEFPYVQDEDGYYVCKSCDWYEEMSWNCNEYISHINHGYSCCKYIKSKYDISYDDEGYIVGTEKKLASKAKKPTKKQSKDGKFDICGYTGADPKLCMCKKCNSRRIAKMSMCNYHGDEYIEFSFESNYLATKLEVKFADKDLVKSKGALWSQKLKCWYVKLSNPNYTELVETY